MAVRIFVRSPGIAVYRRLRESPPRGMPVIGPVAAGFARLWSGHALAAVPVDRILTEFLSSWSEPLRLAFSCEPRTDYVQRSTAVDFPKPQVGSGHGVSSVMTRTDRCASRADTGTGTASNDGTPEGRS